MHLESGGVSVMGVAGFAKFGKHCVYIPDLLNLYMRLLHGHEVSSWMCL